jgi:hypothetical protein
MANRPTMGGLALSTRNLLLVFAKIPEQKFLLEKQASAHFQGYLPVLKTP